MFRSHSVSKAGTAQIFVPALKPVEVVNDISTKLSSDRGDRWTSGLEKGKTCHP
ncbi:hypothetical protein [Nostoc sp. EfeVER01]|uniref:hypothetical protein n=1 Tax=Nostoc sp. EfeVER01 TaxID=3075406 RepID=UPI00391B5AAA